MNCKSGEDSPSVPDVLLPAGPLIRHVQRQANYYGTLDEYSIRVGVEESTLYKIAAGLRTNVTFSTVDHICTHDHCVTMWEIYPELDDTDDLRAIARRMRAQAELSRSIE